jgi:hypothetical protein
MIPIFLIKKISTTSADNGSDFPQFNQSSFNYKLIQFLFSPKGGKFRQKFKFETEPGWATFLHPCFIVCHGPVEKFYNYKLYISAFSFKISWYKLIDTAALACRAYALLQLVLWFDGY